MERIILEIYFKKEIGDIIDIFDALYMVVNMEKTEGIVPSDLKDRDEEVHKYLNSIKVKSTLNMEKVNFYYKEYQTIRESFTIFRLFINSLYDKKNKETESIKYNFTQKTEKEILKGIYYEILRYIESKYNVKNSENKKNPSKDDIVEIIKQLEIPAEAKWNLFLVVDNPVFYYDDFCRLMEQYLPYHEKFHRKMKERKEEFNDYIKHELKNRGEEFIKEIKIVEELKNFQDIYISTIMMRYGSILYEIKDNNLYINLGLRYRDTLRKYRGKSKREYIISIMKSLGDESRFKILTLLKEKALYGQELAEKMGLTTATISHHMNYLHGTGLVTVDKIDNKVYYKLNEESIQNFIVNFKEEFNIK